MSIRTKNSRIVYQNRWMALREDAIERADGSAGIYSFMDRSDFALIIPQQDDSLYLVEQFRYPVKQRMLEFPQGTWEKNPKAQPLEIARLELEEETGLRAAQMDYIGNPFIAEGMANQSYHIYHATQLTQGVQRLEQEEQDLVVKQFTIEEFERLIQKGVIKDSATITAWYLLQLQKRASDLGSSE